MRIEMELAAFRAGRPAATCRCPFYHPDSDSCRAALPGVRIEWRRRRTLCTSEDHDDCTVFLGKILRSSRPKARLEPWPLGQK